VTGYAGKATMVMMTLLAVLHRIAHSVSTRVFMHSQADSSQTMASVCLVGSC